MAKCLVGRLAGLGFGIRRRSPGRMPRNAVYKGLSLVIARRLIIAATLLLISSCVLWKAPESPAQAMMSLGDRRVGSLDVDEWQSLGSSVPIEGAEWGRFAPDLTVAQVMYLLGKDYTPKTLDLANNSRRAKSQAELNASRHAIARRVLRFASAGVKPQVAGDCIGHGLDYESYSAWSARNFDCSEASLWMRSNVTAPGDAAEWRRLGVEPYSYHFYEESRVSLRKASELAGHGLDVGNLKQVILALQLQQTGYDLDKSIYYAKNNVSPASVEQFDRAVKESNVRKRIAAHQCPDGVHSTYELAMISPYSAKGKCYELAGVVLQWLAPRQALVRCGGVALVDFRTTPVSNVINGLMIGTGAFTYTDALGVLRIVPRLRVLH